MPKTSSTEVTLVDEHSRALRAHSLRKEGKGWNVIADEVGYDNGEVARQMVARTLKRASLNLSQERLDEILAMELSELAELQDAAWPAAMMGDTKSIDAVLKVKAQVHKLLGFDRREEKITNQTLIVPADRFVETLKEAIEERERA